MSSVHDRHRQRLELKAEDNAQNHGRARISGEILSLPNNRNRRAVAFFPDMSTRFQRVEELYHQALERTQGERSAFLETACAEDDELRREVESLLASHEQARAKNFIEAPDRMKEEEGSSTNGSALIGRTLGAYQVLSLVGRGGMGEVYRAKDSRLGREVAIKILPTGFSTDADRLRRFEQEARAAGRLNHPNVLAIHDVGFHEGSPYIVSELLEGQTLRDRLQRTALPLRKAMDYALQIARGLAAAHGKGIVHRDLKPENLFITKDGHVKILDFGLAKLRQKPNAILGHSRIDRDSEDKFGRHHGHSWLHVTGTGSGR